MKPLSDRQVIVWCSGFAACCFFYLYSGLIEYLIDLYLLWMFTFVLLVFPILFYVIYENWNKQKK